MQVLAPRNHPASLKDLVCASIQTKPECTENLPQELVSYLEEYKKRRFVTIFFVADEEGTVRREYLVFSSNDRYSFYQKRKTGWSLL
ncbi:Hypothetical protein BRZCDTV_86 [Brazilian cedratvirus IHUMI]|uniref:Uncharacterized protein n=1 Tax=Brazilian cedratvirus IHUMI TaxID=2126980 RepID=A0A2R8FD72_9VIRU|nr:Hypothetical protein BRZCDTV_86 [Brazilian cedratvirus IHUMI]